MNSLFEGKTEFEILVYKKWSKYLHLKFIEQKEKYFEEEKMFVTEMTNLQNEMREMLNEDIEKQLEEEFKDEELVTSEYIEYLKEFYIISIVMKEELKSNGNKLSFESEMFIRRCAKNIGIYWHSEPVEGMIEYANGKWNFDEVDEP